MEDERVNKILERRSRRLGLSTVIPQQQPIQQTVVPQSYPQTNKQIQNTQNENKIQNYNQQNQQILSQQKRQTINQLHVTPKKTQQFKVHQTRQQELQKLRSKLQQFIPGYQNQQPVSEQTNAMQAQYENNSNIKQQFEPKESSNLEKDSQEQIQIDQDNQQLNQQQQASQQQDQQQDQNQIQLTNNQQYQENQQLFNNPEIEDQYTLKPYQYQGNSGKTDVLDAVMTLNALNTRLLRNSNKKVNIFTSQQYLQQQIKDDAQFTQQIDNYKQMESNCDKSMVQQQMYGQQEQQYGYQPQQTQYQTQQIQQSINYNQLQQDQLPHSFVTTAMIQKHEIDTRKGLNMQNNDIQSIENDFSQEPVVLFKQINQVNFVDSFVGKQNNFGNSQINGGNQYNISGYNNQNDYLTTKSLGITVEEEPLDEKLDKQIDVMSKTAKLMLDTEQMKRDDYQLLLQKNELECKRMSYDLMKYQPTSNKISENTIRMSQMQKIQQPKKISQMTEDEVNQMLQDQVKEIIV